MADSKVFGVKIILNDNNSPVAEDTSIGLYNVTSDIDGTSDGQLSFVEQFDAGIFTQHAAIDGEKKIGFSSAISPINLRTYTYDTDGDFTHVDTSGRSSDAYQIALDTTLTPRLVFVASGYQSTSNIMSVPSQSSGISQVQ